MEELKFLCFLDVLGFESLFKSMGLKKIAECYDKLAAYVKKQEGGLDIIPLPDGHVAVGWLAIGNAYFSDSILFWTQDKVSLPSFTHLIAETICYGIELRLPFRGTISCGKAILDSEFDKYLGEPIFEAKHTEELQKWIGASFGSSFANHKGFYLNTVLPYKSHYKDIKSKYATGIVVDWPRRWRESRKTDVRPLISAMDNKQDFSEYYKNTLKFIEFSEQNHDWFKKQAHLDYG